MTDIEILQSASESIFQILHSSSTVDEKEQQIRELTSDIEGELLIEKSSYSGCSWISAIRLKAKTVNLFEEFNFAELSLKCQLFSRLYTAYLLCKQTDNPKELYKALLEYERVTHYPITKCCPSDKEWMMVEASVILDSTLVQPKSTSETSPDNELVKVIKKVFPEAQVKSWF